MFNEHVTIGWKKSSIMEIMLRCHNLTNIAKCGIKYIGDAEQHVTQVVSVTVWCVSMENYNVGRDRNMDCLEDFGPDGRRPYNL